MHAKSAKSSDVAVLKAAEFAADRIRQQILDGLLAPGQRLLEAEFVAQLGMSRSTVREAFLKLDGEGLVELRHQRGSMVKRMTGQDMAELFEVREKLEGLAASLAAGRVEHGDNRAQLLAARAAWQQDDVLDNEMRHMEQNVLLHAMIIEMSGNRRLQKMLQPLQIPGYRMQYLKLLDRPVRLRSAAEHLEIIDALLAGDGERAERLMQQHVREAGALALQIPGLQPLPGTDAGS